MYILDEFRDGIHWGRHHHHQGRRQIHHLSGSSAPFILIN